jgi:peptidoglycan/xylan/chitin deacetylase (PgdA/CDA1 family)
MKKNSPRLLFGTFSAIFIVVVFLVINKYYHSSSPGAVTSSLSNNSVLVNPINANTTLSPETSLISAVPIPIFMYHYIRDHNDPNDKVDTNLSVSPSIFTSEILKFKELNYNTVSLNEYLNGRANVKSIIISFDDGYDDAYLAYQTLKQNQMTGTFYIITNRIGTEGYLTASQIKEMADNGMTIGSHTLSHPDLSTASDATATKELTESKRLLESIIGKPVVDFCYPSGKYTQKTIDLVKKAGYKTAVTTTAASKTNFRSFYELPRLRVNPTNSSTSLVSRINKLME